MFLSAILFYSLIIISDGAICEIKRCDIGNSKCLTITTGLVFKPFISGIPGVEPSDPLNKDCIEVNLPTLKYKLTNSSLSGLINCHVEHVEINQTELKYQYHIGCPHLTINSEYELNGKIDTDYIEAKGTYSDDLYDYKFRFDGDYENKIYEDDKVHMHMQKYNLDVQTKDRDDYCYDIVLSGEKNKSDTINKIASKHWKLIHKLTLPHVVNAFMEKYMVNIEAYVKVVPFDNLFCYITS